MNITEANRYQKIVKWVWLSIAIGEGCKNSSDVIDFSTCDPCTVYDINDFSGISGKNKIFTKHQAERLANKDLSQAERIVEYCEKNGIKILTPSDDEYPNILLNTQACPAVLYCLGRMPDLEQRISISCVGTRKMSRVGKRAGYEIAYDLAKCGIVITSGLALGIDSICHSAALDAGGTTIAVLGSGIDNIYPAQNASLMKEIVSLGGAVITEFAPGTPPIAHNFPVRNRIVSALSVGTLVVEAGERSGSLNTARHCVEQGRDLFSIPGETGEFTHMGSNLLLKQGAITVTEAADIVSFYTQRYGDKIKFDQIFKRETLRGISTPEISKSSVLPEKFIKDNKDKKAERSDKIKNKTKNDASDTQIDNKRIPKEIPIRGNTSGQIIELLSRGPLFPDEISEKLSYSIKDTMTELSLLELEGVVTVMSGGKYTL